LISWFPLATTGSSKVTVDNKLEGEKKGVVRSRYTVKWQVSERDKREGTLTGNASQPMSSKCWPHNT
jgi:hypothetical protein